MQSGEGKADISGFNWVAGGGKCGPKGNAVRLVPGRPVDLMTADHGVVTIHLVTDIRANSSQAANPMLVSGVR